MFRKSLFEKDSGGASGENRKCVYDGSSQYHGLRLLFPGKGKNLRCNGRSVPPDAFQIVEKTVFFVKDMDDNIPVVQKHPVGRLVALNLPGSASDFPELLFYLIRHGLHLVAVGTAGDQEIIGQNGYMGNVQNAHVQRLFVL